MTLNNLVTNSCLLLQNRKAESVLKKKLQGKSKKLLSGENGKCRHCSKIQHRPELADLEMEELSEDGQENNQRH